MRHSLMLFVHTQNRDKPRTRLATSIHISECSTVELIARAAFMHHDQWHDALRHDAIVKEAQLLHVCGNGSRETVAVITESTQNSLLQEVSLVTQHCLSTSCLVT